MSGDAQALASDAPQLHAFAPEWPDSVRSRVLIAASNVCASAAASSDLAPASTDRWLGALTQHLNEPQPSPSSSGSDRVEDHAVEIANDLLLVSLRLMPATPTPPSASESHKGKERDQAGTASPSAPEPTYTATDRLLMHNTMRELELDLTYAHEAEKSVAQQLFFVVQAAEAQAQAEAKKSKWGSSTATSLNNKKSGWKWAATGAGFLAGGVALGVTGGLAAPLLAPLLVTASGGALAFLGTSGGVILIGSLFGIAGGGLTGARVKRRIEGIKMFQFDKIQVDKDLPDIPSLHATIVCNGIQTRVPTKASETQPYKASKLWSKGYSKMSSKFSDKASDKVADQGTSYVDAQLADSQLAAQGAANDDEQGGWRRPFQKAYESHFGMRDLFALKIDPEDFAALGNSLEHFTRDLLVNKGVTEVLKHTALAAFMSAVTLPATIYTFSTKLLDSEWIRCLDKAKKAGPVLADVLQERVQGQRPVILVGTSLGAVTILHALVSLSERLQPNEMKDLVYSATLISLPICPNQGTWEKARSVVAGPLVNAWSRNDWVLALLARASIHADMSANAPSGLAAVNLPGVTDIDLSDLLKGHMQLTNADVVAQVLHRTEVDERRTAPPPPNLPPKGEPIRMEGPTEEEIQEAIKAQKEEEQELERQRQANQAQSA